MKREAVVAVLASEGLALVSVSARTASSVVVVPFESRVFIEN